MNAAQVGKLLGLMSLVDYRKVPEDRQERSAMIAFWLDLVGDIPYSDAERAVREHYAESTERLMPAHIRSRVREMRAQRLRLNPVPAPPAELLDDGVAYAAWLERETERIASGEAERKAIGGRP